MLHWGSKYSPQKKRRTIRLGYRSFGRSFPRQKCSLPTGFPNRFGDGISHRRIAEQWLALYQDKFATIEEIFHAVLQEDDEKFCRTGYDSSTRGGATEMSDTVVEN